MKIPTRAWKVFINIWFSLRFLLPLYVFINPLVGTAISLFMDVPDGYFSFRAKMRWEWYHKWDKLADYWWYILIVTYSYVNNLPILKALLILFVLRSVGQFIILKKKESWMLIFFPNILENYFVAYLLIPKFLPAFPYNLYIFATCTIIALIREYLIHIKKAYAANYIFKLGINWGINN